MSIAGLLRRLTRMSSHEIYTRTRQAASRRSDVLLHRIGADPIRFSGSDYEARGEFFRPASEIPAIAAAVRRRLPEQAERILADAGSVLSRRFDLLGYRGLSYGDDIDWGLDPVHGRSAAHLPWPEIDFLRFDVAGDHKIVWELNRHQFLVTLARAFRLTGDAKYADALKDLWLDWQRKNPYPLGVNWTSTLEVAFRTLAWMWAAFLLEGTPADSADFQQRLAREVERAGWYIDRYLSTYFSPNTHLLGEAVALFILAARYPGLKQAKRWRTSAWTVIDEACSRQVRADGFYFEQSTYYHVYALDFFLQARLIASRNGIPIPNLLEDTIARMGTAILSLAQGSALPRYGDDDGGRLFDGRRNSAAEMLDPLSTLAVLYRDPALKSTAGTLREETLWLLGPSSESVFDSIVPTRQPPRSNALKESGFYSLVSGEDPPAQLVVDAGEHGSLSAGHGHADALSIQLAWQGRLWLTDPGTCWYLGPDSRRNKFRGTAAHNTVTVDGLDQAEPRTPFSWGPLPKTEVVDWIAGNGFDLFHGRHSGYTRLPRPVTHARWVVRAGPRLWLVRDILDGQGVHEIGIHWHFPPDLTAALQNGLVVATDGSHTLTLIPEQGATWEYAVEQDEFSPAYGQYIPAPTARGRFRAECPAEIATVLLAGEAPPAGVELRRIRNEAISVYEYVHGAEHRLFCFSSAAPWQHGAWESDARYFCATRSENENGFVLCAAHVSFIRHNGGTVMELPVSADQWQGATR